MATYTNTSDQMARGKHAFPAEDTLEEASTEQSQTSNKSGKHSSVERLAASRPEHGTGRGARLVAGAFGDDPSHQVTGRDGGPDANVFRCDVCGRHFPTQKDLSAHEVECRAAKLATSANET